MMKPMKTSGSSTYLLTLLIAWSVMISLTVTAIVYNNSPRSVPIFLFLFASGIAVMAGLGLGRGGILALFIVSISIVIKQLIGAWSKDNLIFNLIEAFMMAGALSIGGYYHDRLRTYFGGYDEAQEKLKILDLEEASIGLIKPAIGQLRLKEESERAIRFRRPLSFVLILILPPPGKQWDAREMLAVMRAVATTVKDSIRALDIPFLVDHEKIALILTDTEINGTNAALNHIRSQLDTCRVVRQDGSAESLARFAQIRFAFSVFLGYHSQPFDMLEAAERSLQRNVEMNLGGVFQNVFLDWELIGEVPTFDAILPPRATRILDSVPSGLAVIENYAPPET